MNEDKALGVAPSAPGYPLQPTVSASIPNAASAEAHEISAVHPDQAREELWGLLMPMAIIRELTGTQHQDGYATVEAVRSALNPQPKAGDGNDKPVAWMREGWGPDCGPYYELYRDDEMGWRDRKDWTPLYSKAQLKEQQ